MGFDERTFDQLTPEERGAAKQIIYQKFGLTPDKLAELRVRQYITQSPKETETLGEIKAEVFRTNQEDLYLQELTYPDGEKAWLIGPDQNI